MKLLPMILLAALSALTIDGQETPAQFERITWGQSRSSEFYESISVTVVNNLNLPITSTALNIDFYRDDGVKLAEGHAFMDRLPPHERAIYTYDVDKGYVGMAGKPAYIQIGSLEGDVDGRRYSITPPDGAPKIWSPVIQAAMLKEELATKKIEEKRRKQAEREKKRQKQN